MWGIIPARAGFTHQVRGGRQGEWDHPRSRGVYAYPSTLSSHCWGSSPLARGLRWVAELVADCVGIIPARAGFTTMRYRPAFRLRDHPRSRGVYWDLLRDQGERQGSSPLARGLHSARRVDVLPPRIIPARAGFTRRHGHLPPAGGIIPARAGFTPSPRRAPAVPRDHPRSRGVYFTIWLSTVPSFGSSPLARGLLGDHDDVHIAGRIIPARAGFTGRPLRRCPERPDHPRSRGVYWHKEYLPQGWDGSSPLARGLHGQGHPVRGQDRIIPARAGFTTTAPPQRHRRVDHPRSRGVYGSARQGSPHGRGSSPLARGLQVRPHPGRGPDGIIPARAGFTRPESASSTRRTDHPRSRGVYGVVVVGQASRYGSSPLARGLLSSLPQQVLAAGIIPARAGFTRRTPRGG